MDLVFVGPVLVAAIVSLLIVSSVCSSQPYALNTHKICMPGESI